MFQQDTEKAYQCFSWQLEHIPAVAPWQIQQQQKIHVKEHNPISYFPKNWEREVAYSVVDDMECIPNHQSLLQG